MTANLPQTWFLNGPTGWRTSEGAGVVAGAGGLRLAAVAGGPLSLQSADDSLGGLTLPRRLALDERGRLYLISEHKRAVLRFNPDALAIGPQHPPQWFQQVLPAASGSPQTEAPKAIAALGPWLYVAGLTPRWVEVYDQKTLRAQLIWTDELAEVVWPGQPWRPQDLAAGRDAVFILDGGARVWRHEPLAPSPCPCCDKNRLPAGMTGEWQRVAVDREGCVHLLRRDNNDGHWLDVFDAAGNYVQSVDDPGAVRDNFEPPAVRVDRRGRFCLPSHLQSLCPKNSDAPPPAEDPLRSCRRTAGATPGLVFGLDGRRVPFDPSEPLVAPGGKLNCLEDGSWLAGPLDSAIAQCVWHRIELEMKLPPATAVTVYTLNDEIDTPPWLAADWQHADWALCGRFVAEVQPRPDQPALDGETKDCLVQSLPGRFLWLRVDLSGDGFATPVVRSLRLHFPRRTYLEFLPPVYQEDLEARRFLEQFLSVFQTEWDAIESRVAGFAGRLDPRAAPDRAALDFLAGWLGTTLEADWSLGQNRRLLEAIPQVLASSAESSRGEARSGTLESLRRLLVVYLENINQLPAERIESFPLIVEGYRERRFLALGSGRPLGAETPLWSRDVMARLQLGVHARVGEVRLDSSPAPHLDVFRHYAHRFRVFVPTAWVRTAEEERMIRRVIDTEKPAHTDYELTLVEPFLRIGVQASLGVDTVLGDYRPARLGCRSDPVAPPSAPLRPRLGLDTMLAECPELPPPRLGINTVMADDAPISFE